MKMMMRIWDLAYISTLALFAYGFTIPEDEYHPLLLDKKPFVTRIVEEDKFFWNKVADKELRIALRLTENDNIAKNVIIFLGDGMSLPSITAARIYSGQQNEMNGEEGLLSFEKFPHIALSKTYNVNYQVPDSAGTATAFLTGVKTNAGVIGVDATVTRGKCETMTPDSITDSIVMWSQDAGKRTGIVTTTRITHATPASAYAHSVDRKWECDSRLPEEYDQVCPLFKDIARQLVENEPGKSLNVIMGGGYQFLDGSAVETEGDPLTWSCKRLDGRKLWKQFLQNNWNKGKKASFVRNKSELNKVDLGNTDHLMGIFANSHLPFDFEIKQHSMDVPTLGEMTEKAIKILDKEDEGYFLLVEGGRIDHAHHGGYGKIALDEIVAFDNAIQTAMKLTNEKDTLIIVTADHSHTMSVSGYPGRGNPITGFASTTNKYLPYTTLSYANGPGYNNLNYDISNGTNNRRNLTDTDVSSFQYQQIAPIHKRSETHGGDDVGIYARGPMSHLFHSVHEQNYIAHVMAYASCVGLYRNYPHCIEDSDEDDDNEIDD